MKNRVAEKENLFPKKYYECFAKNVLSKVLPYKVVLRELKCGSDYPDLVSNDETVGIEVTRGIDEDIGKRQKLVQLKYNKEYFREEIIEEAERLGIEDDLVHTKDFVYLGTNTMPAEEITILAESIYKKLERLNAPHFNLYEENALFVFCSMPQKDIERAFHMIDWDFYGIRFDRVFLLSDNILYVYDFDKMMRTELSSDIIKKLAKKTRKEIKNLK